MYILTDTEGFTDGCIETEGEDDGSDDVGGFDEVVGEPEGAEDFVGWLESVGYEEYKKSVRTKWHVQKVRYTTILTDTEGSAEVLGV